MINYADYQKRAKETKKIREMIMQRALITNDPSIIDDLEDEDWLDDPEGIAIPWEEKYGKKDCKKGGAKK